MKKERRPEFGSFCGGWRIEETSDRVHRGEVRPRHGPRCHHTPGRAREEPPEGRAEYMVGSAQGHRGLWTGVSRGGYARALLRRRSTRAVGVYRRRWGK